LPHPIFEGQVLNPDGKKIWISFDVFRKLRRIKYPKRVIVKDRASGMYRMTEAVHGLLDLWSNGPEFTYRPVYIMNPDRIGEGGKSPDCGMANSVMRTLGEDLSGVGSPTSDFIRRLRGKPEEYLQEGALPSLSSCAMGPDPSHQAPTNSASCHLRECATVLQ
jgi:hypothetical protein